MTCGSLANFENVQLSHQERVAYLYVAELSREFLHAKFNLGNDVKREI